MSDADEHQLPHVVDQVTSFVPETTGPHWLHALPISFPLGVNTVVPLSWKDVTPKKPGTGPVQEVRNRACFENVAGTSNFCAYDVPSPPKAIILGWFTVPSASGKRNGEEEQSRKMGEGSSAEPAGMDPERSLRRGPDRRGG